MTLSIIRSIDRSIATIGFIKTIKQWFAQRQIKLVIHGLDEELTQILQHEAVVIVANHPFMFEPLSLLGALPEREDIYVVITAVFLSIFKSADKHFLPVHITHRPTHRNNWDLPGQILEKLHPQPQLSEEETRMNNRKSISLGSEKLSQGGMVVIFPNRRSRDGSWFPGVGYLISGVSVNKSVFLVNVFIMNTSNWDYLRFIPFVNKILPQIQVFFSKPAPITVTADLDAKGVTHTLENDYNSWIKGLN